MATYEITAPDGSKWDVTAPDSATEAEVLARVMKEWEHSKSFPSGYMTPEEQKKAMEQFGKGDSILPGDKVQPVPGAPKSVSEPVDPELARLRNREAGIGARNKATGKKIDRAARVAQIKAELAGMDTYNVADDGVTVTVNEVDEKRKAALEEELATLAPSETGYNVGSIGGGLGGALAGAAVGTAVAPGVGTVVGGVLGSLAGSSAGTYLGTQYDLSKVTDLSEEEVDELMNDRLIENAVLDAGGNVVLLGGGKVLGKFLKNTKAGKALSEKVALWLEERGLSKVEPAPNSREEIAAYYAPKTHAEKKAASRVKGIAEWEDREATRQLVKEGVLPTKGQLGQEPTFLENWLRKAEPDMFIEQQRQLGRIAEKRRDEALAAVSPNGFAQDPTGLGEAVQYAIRDADEAIKEVYRPIRERVDASGVSVNLTDVKTYVDKVLADTKAAYNSQLSPQERELLSNLSKDLGAKPVTDVTSALDFRSGNSAKLRDLEAPDAPSEYFKKVLTTMNNMVNGAIEAGTSTLPADLRTAFKDVSKQYGDTMADLYSPTMQKILRSNPEKMGQIIAQEGNVTQIRELRAALNRIDTLTEAFDTDGMLNAVRRGFIEQNFPTMEALATMEKKLHQPKFKTTYKELFKDSMFAEMNLRAAGRLAEIALREVKADTLRNIFIPALAGTVGGLSSGSGVSGATTAISVFAAQRMLQRMIVKSMLYTDKGMLNKVGKLIFDTKKQGVSGVVPPATVKLAAELLEELDIKPEE